MNWAEYLQSRDCGTHQVHINHYAEFLQLRETAKRLSEHTSRRYQVWEDRDNGSIFHIKVSEK